MKNIIKMPSKKQIEQKTKMTFEEWLDLNEDECNIYFAETGMDRELDFDIENELEKFYEMYLKDDLIP
jgi:hypothetical protein